MRRTTQQLAIAPDALELTGPDKPVSFESVWSDPIWRLDGRRMGASLGSVSVFWPTDIDPHLLEAFRRLLWSLYVAPSDRAPPTAATMASTGWGIGILARWMDEEAYDFCHVGRDLGRSLQAYLRQRAAEASVADYGIDEPDEKVPEERKGADPVMSFGAVAACARAIAAVHRQRRVLRRLGVPVPDEDPLDGLTAKTWAMDVRPPGPERDSALPDEVARPLMAATDRLVSSGAFDDVISLMERYLDVFNRSNGKSHNRKVRALRTMVGHSFRTIPGEDQPWHPTLVAGRGDRAEHASGWALRRLMSFAQNVCALLVLQLTGMRPGEIVALASGTDPETGLPSCIERSTSPGGNLTVFHAVSTITKGRAAPETERWLLGAVPVGTGALPTTVEAIRLIERLNRPWRSISSDATARSSLIVCYTSAGVPDRASAITRMTVNQLGRSLKETYPLLVDLQSLPSVDREGLSLDPYRRCGEDGTPDPLLRMTQWRKTFATSVTKIDSELTPALRRQFKHYRAASLDGAYVSADTRLFEAVADARTSTVMSIFRARLEGASVAVGRGNRLLDRRLAAIRRASEDEAVNGAGAMRELAEIHAPAAWRAEHAVCAFFIAPHRAACHEASGNPSFLHDRPDFGMRTPDMCVGCPNVIIDVSHLGFWRRRFLEAREAARSEKDKWHSATMSERATKALSVILAIRRGQRKSTMKKETAVEQARAFASD